MAMLKFWRGVGVNNQAIADGQLLFDTESKKIYLDNGTTRVELYGDLATALANSGMTGENAKTVAQQITAALATYATKAEAQGYADAKDAAIGAAKDAADAAQGAADTLADKVGTVPENKTVVGMISEAQAAATYDDTALTGRVATVEDAINGTGEGDEHVKGLAEKVADNASAISTLNGEGTGSVKKAVDDALNKFATDVSNDDVVNTYKELVDWAASHGAEAAEIAGALAALTAAVGEAAVPAVGEEGQEGYVPAKAATGLEKKIADEIARATGAEGGLDTRIKALEDDTTVGTKADKVTGATAGNFAGLDANGNLTDSGAKAADFDEAGAAAAALASAKTYVEGLLAWNEYTTVSE